MEPSLNTNKLHEQLNKSSVNNFPLLEKLLLMTEEQLDFLRDLIKQEIDAAQIDGMEHGAWGWADKQLEKGWREFKDSFKST